ncbi:MAG: cation-transporting P-type ATPase [Propionicimonas sp.]|nr:cation-transporting P-type ATPase [Propionicimonas sp.]
MSSDGNLSTLDETYSGGGLTTADVRQRRAQYGVNEVPEQRPGPVLGTLRRMWDPVSWRLESAIVFELVLGKTIQALFVLALLVFSAVTGQLQASRAAKAIGYLRRQLQVSARTLRDGAWATLPARELVPGDVVRVGVGDIVPADVRIDQGTVSVDEA